MFCRESLCRELCTTPKETRSTSNCDNLSFSPCFYPVFLFRICIFVSRIAQPLWIKPDTLFERMRSKRRRIGSQETIISWSTAKVASGPLGRRKPRDDKKRCMHAHDWAQELELYCHVLFSSRFIWEVLESVFLSIRIHCFVFFSTVFQVHLVVQITEKLLLRERQ